MDSQMKINVSDNLHLPDTTVTSTVVVYGGKGMGKRLAVDTPLATPSGWITMGDVRVGDVLFDQRGEPCRVTYVSPIVLGETYRVVFSDKSSIVADAEHLWVTQTLRERKHGKPPGVRTTSEIANSLTVMQGSQAARNHAIRNCLSLRLPQVELPIDPYMLGFWLGDGSTGAGVVSVGHV